MDDRRLASLNPLRISGTSMRPNVLLAAKLLALCVLVTGRIRGLPYHFLPLVAFLGRVGSPREFHRGLELVFLVAALALFCNQFVRTACLLLGLVFVVAVLSSAEYWHNNVLYTGLFFVLAALDGARSRISLFRYQLAVLYFGAAWNKLALSDWRDGAFVKDWLPHYFHGYPHVASLFPDTTLSTGLGWVAMVTEAALVVLLLVPRFVPLAIFVGVGYHTGLVTMTKGWTFGMFWYALTATYVALLEWPTAPVVVRYSPTKLVHRLGMAAVERFDFEGWYRWLPERVDALQARVDGATYEGVGAGARVLLYCPIAYAVFAVVCSSWPVVIPFTFLFLAAIAYGEFVRQGVPRFRSSVYAGGPRIGGGG